MIFDINGEYANDNPQDDSKSLNSVYKDICKVFAFRPRDGSDADILKMNFYENTQRSHKILSDLLGTDNRDSIYIRGFTGAEIPSIESLDEIEDYGDRTQSLRRILIYWAILRSAGFDADERYLAGLIKHQTNRNAASRFDPGYNQDLRRALYPDTPLPPIMNLTALMNEYSQMAEFIRSRDINTDPLLLSNRGRPLFDAEDRALLQFLKPRVGAGPIMLNSYTSALIPKYVRNEFLTTTESTKDTEISSKGVVLPCFPWL